MAQIILQPANFWTRSGSSVVCIFVPFHLEVFPQLGSLVVTFHALESIHCFGSLGSHYTSYVTHYRQG